MIKIRIEKKTDVKQVFRVNLEAFGQPEEAIMVDKLRALGDDVISLVAEDDGFVVGHILFSPVYIESNGKQIKGMGLAPMAVLPGFQKIGIGSKLVRAGLQILSDCGYPYVIVLGHAEYYPRFGFEPASQYGISCQWSGVPDKAFMILIFDKIALSAVKGTARYRDEFNEVM